MAWEINGNRPDSTAQLAYAQNSCRVSLYCCRQVINDFALATTPPGFKKKNLLVFVTASQTIGLITVKSKSQATTFGKQVSKKIHIES